MASLLTILAPCLARVTNASPEQEWLSCASGRRCWHGLGLLSLIAASYGCSDPELKHPAWNSLSPDEVENRLSNPTGTFSQRLSEPTQTRLDALMPKVLDLMTFLAQLSDVAESVAAADLSDSSLPQGSAGAPTQDDDETVSGASVFVRVACPGTQTERPFSFENGYLQLETPRLDQDGLDSLLSEGDLLFDFESCALSSTTRISAEIPAHYLNRSATVLETPEGADQPQLALAFDFAATSEDSPLGILAFACGEAGEDCSSDMRIAFELNAGTEGSFVIAFHATKSWWNREITELTVTLRSSASESSCSYSRTSETLTCATD